MIPLDPLDPNTSLKMVRVIQAPQEKVFDAFIVPELRRKWWASKPGSHCNVCEIDGRVGGHYRINMVTPDGECNVTGTFREIVRPEKQVFTWSWTTGEVVDSIVTILFKALGPKTTELTLIHEKLPAGEIRDLHMEGWIGCGESLAAFVEE